jgi:hypothetical protein
MLVAANDQPTAVAQSRPNAVEAGALSDVVEIGEGDVHRPAQVVGEAEHAVATREGPLSEPGPQRPMRARSSIASSASTPRISRPMPGATMPAPRVQARTSS